MFDRDMWEVTSTDPRLSDEMTPDELAAEVTPKAAPAIEVRNES